VKSYNDAMSVTFYSVSRIKSLFAVLTY